LDNQAVLSRRRLFLMAVPLDVQCVFYFLHQLGDISHVTFASVHDFTAGAATPFTLMMLLLASLEGKNSSTVNSKRK
jgi:hypothetical protein